jgi:hypothetical protein
MLEIVFIRMTILRPRWSEIAEKGMAATISPTVRQIKRAV